MRREDIHDKRRLNSTAPAESVGCMTPYWIVYESVFIQSITGPQGGRAHRYRRMMSLYVGSTTSNVLKRLANTDRASGMIVRRDTRVISRTFECDRSCFSSGVSTLLGSVCLRRSVSRSFSAHCLALFQRSGATLKKTCTMRSVATPDYGNPRLRQPPTTATPDYGNPRLRQPPTTATPDYGLLTIFEGFHYL
jgi:hypothetical protein